MRFSFILISWYEQHHRKLPWRNTRDAYRIWLSEIILQQTRVDQGLPYYHRFLNAYPTVQDLAAAPQDEVLKLWQGLGYYSRARNLHKAAQQVVNEHSGVFPPDYRALLGLAGVGPYTAAAIASFAFCLPHAVVDGNVYRILSRYFGVELPIDRPHGRKYFAALATEVLDKARPDLHNQAIMEFGARQCTSHNPDCTACPLSNSCKGLRTNKVLELPKKEGRTKVREVWMDYLVVEHDGRIGLRQRNQKGIWQGLYDFPLLEYDRDISRREAQSSKAWKEIVGTGSVEILTVTERITHRLSHRLLYLRFWHLISDQPPHFPGIMMVDREKLPTFVVPVVIDQWLSGRGLI